MQPYLILLPVFALVALTFAVGIWLAKLRISAVKRGELNAKYFKLNSGATPPDYLLRVSHNYDNLLALPVLFYVISIILFITDKVEIIQLILAWLFVATRYIHSYIHTTYNHVLHRLISFFLGVAILLCMWCLLLISVLSTEF